MEQAPAIRSRKKTSLSRPALDGKWHLGIDDEKSQSTRKHYKYPYGDFAKVHRCALLSAQSRAGQYKHFDIERAAAHLHGMIEETKQRVA
jgi:hypothetical protein